jgi:hypothetical protein
MTESKNDTISKIYYEHFGSIKRTLKEAREINPDIKEKDIKAWKDREISRKINLTGDNSFVASRPREEFQVDIFTMPVSILKDMRKMTQEQINQAQQMYKNQKRRKGEGMAGGSSRSHRPEMRAGRPDKGARRVEQARRVIPTMVKKDDGKYVPQKAPYGYGLLAVDIFTKIVKVEPLLTNDAAALKKALNKLYPQMGGSPETLYSDGESGLKTPDMMAWHKSMKVRLVMTRAHAHFAERHIRTIKDMIFKRLDPKDVDVDDWQTLLPEVLEMYNAKMEHSATGFTPEDAEKPENLATVKGRLQVKALKSRKYPPIEIGDKVKAMQKKDKLDKERVSMWSTTTSVVTQIIESHGQTYYKLNPHPEQWKMDLQRAEILLVN